MVKPQTFDIIAVSIPDSNVQKAVARIMVGADRYLSMQAALDQVRTPPALLFKNMEQKDAEQHITKLKALGVGFRVVRSDGTDDDSVMRDDELPGAKPRKTATQGPIEAARSAAPKPDAPPPVVSIQEAISHHHSDPRGVNAYAHAVGHKSSESVRAGAEGFGSAGGGYGAHGGSGINANSGLLSDLKKSEAASDRKKKAVSIIIAALLVITALLFVVSKEKSFNVKRITFPSMAGGPKKQSKPAGGKDNAGEAAEAATPERPFGGAEPDPERQFDGSREKRRNSVNNQQKQQAKNFVDSAKTMNSSLDKQIAFYKIAISFNQYNLQAWHGLLQAYREMNDAAEIRSTEARMREIFGEEVTSVNAAVSQFGEIVDAYANESGTYRVEYKTKKTSQDEILRDVFNLTRALRNVCKCQNISVFASTSRGNGLIAHSTAATPVHTLPEFSRHAYIVWFD